MRVLLSLFLTVSISYGFSQKNYSLANDGTVTNLEVQYDFKYCSIADFDFNKLENPIRATTSVLIKIGPDGKGNLYFYLDRKTTYYVNSCRLVNGNFVLDFTNIKGTRFNASVIVKNGYVDCFIFKCLEDNTGYILSNS